MRSAPIGHCSDALLVDVMMRAQVVLLQRLAEVLRVCGCIQTELSSLLDCIARNIYARNMLFVAITTVNPESILRRRWRHPSH